MGAYKDIYGHINGPSSAGWNTSCTVPAYMAHIRTYMGAYKDIYGRI
jgi:hypothetical protein